jgi:hypothetical protein
MLKLISAAAIACSISFSALAADMPAPPDPAAPITLKVPAPAPNEIQIMNCKSTDFFMAMMESPKGGHAVPVFMGTGFKQTKMGDDSKNGYIAFRVLESNQLIIFKIIDNGKTMCALAALENTQFVFKNVIHDGDGYKGPPDKNHNPVWTPWRAVDVPEAKE